MPRVSPSVVPSSGSASSRSGAGRLLAVVTTVLLGLLLAVLGATPAAAHDTLEGSDPADGATVATVPTAVSLTFNEEVQNFSPVIQVTGPDGADWADGDPTVSGVQVSVPVKAGAPAGAYSVAYRIVSSDGHPVSGELTFTAQSAGAAAAATVPVPAVESSPAASSPVATSSSAPVSSSPVASPVASSSPTAAPTTTGAVTPAASTTDGGSGFPGWAIALVVVAVVVAVAAVVVALRARANRAG